MASAESKVKTMFRGTNRIAPLTEYLRCYLPDPLLCCFRRRVVEREVERTLNTAVRFCRNNLRQERFKKRSYQVFAMIKQNGNRQFRRLRDCGNFDFFEDWRFRVSLRRRFEDGRSGSIKRKSGGI